MPIPTKSHIKRHAPNKSKRWESRKTIAGNPLGISCIGTFSVILPIDGKLEYMTKQVKYHKKTASYYVSLNRKRITVSKHGSIWTTSSAIAQVTRV